MYDYLTEGFSYNEWPDVNIEGNVLEKQSKTLNEGIEIHTCKKCGKTKIKGEGQCDTCKSTSQLKEDADKPVEDNEEIVDLKTCILNSVGAIEPLDDEESIDPHTVIDTVVNCLSEEDIEYLKSLVCSEDDEGDIPEEELEDLAEGCKKKKQCKDC